MRLLQVCAVFSVCFAVPFEPRVLNRPPLYEGWKVIAVDRQGFQRVKNLELDVIFHGAESVRLLVSPAQTRLLEAEVPFVTLAENFQTILDKESERLNNRTGKEGWWEEFHTFEEIRAWYWELSQEYPDIVTYIPSIGQSFEGRDIFALVFNTNPRVEKPQVFYQSSTHAREWVAQAAAQYVSYNLLVDPRGAALLDEFELIVVPFVNPDGYEFSWTTDREWRKNRRVPPADFPDCYGVDLNRNWDVLWAQGDCPKDPCSNNYPGTHAWSEAETQAVRNFFLSFPRVVGAIDWHTYGQLVLRPYGYRYDETIHEAFLFACGEAVRQAIRSVNGNNYLNIRMVEDELNNGLLQTGSGSEWFYSRYILTLNPIPNP